MASSLLNTSTYSRFNLSQSESDIQVFVKEYGYRIKKEFAREDEGGRSAFVSFAEKKLSLADVTWLQDNQERFFKDTPNENLLSLNYLSQTGYICAMVYSHEGKYLVVGHSTGLIQADITYKVQKLRLQFIPKKLQRMHYGQVCAIRCHDQNPKIFASGAWDNTLRIWDLRCKVGCVMTFEGVNICSDSIDLNRDNCIVGSWQPTEALTIWNLVAKKKLHTVRVQNRRPDVDGEYIYACRYWRSKEYNRKGKYGIIGGSGTNCVEIINLHNRYVSCSYPAPGTVLAITSHNEKIAFGGTAPVLNIVSFHDPKHEKHNVESEPEYDYTIRDPNWFDEKSNSDMKQTSQVKTTISNVTSSLTRDATSDISQPI
ncbi:jg21273 [Pararge aegeria aegeria]|uniref:Jg21273 protein n=1 Tax=Pararge aegeria aegeria TaxID=348720 RepID=A0A8S4SH08_9NEOP|nr:jg21273 [Pararge aegeria aegeria]